MNLNMKFISKFNHGFTNGGCLHWAFVKALYVFEKKRAHKARDMQFFRSIGSKWDFQDFENVWKQHKIY